MGMVRHLTLLLRGMQLHIKGCGELGSLIENLLRGRLRDESGGGG